jgi:hypothetical protein
MPFTTELELVNAALRKVGARAISAISDTTPAGAIIGDVLTSERDALLQSYTWNFAVARADLSPLAGATVPVFEFDNAFALPSDWLRTISVHSKADYTIFVRYKMETANVAAVWTRCICTDTVDIYLRYVRQTTGDAGVAIMSPGFQECLILRLARVFASGLANSNTLLQLVDAEYKQALERARLTDEIEDYPDSLSADHWSASIVNVALRMAGIRRFAEAEQMLPAGIVQNEVLIAERDALLRLYTWNFAVARADLSTVVATPSYEFTTAFGLPSDFLRLIAVRDKTTFEPVRYALETITVVSTFTQVILTNAADIYIRYVRKTDDATLMPALFRQALSLRLATYFVTGLPNGAELAQRFAKELQAVIAAAQAANEIEDHVESVPPSYWAYEIANVALRKVGLIRGADAGSKIPAFELIAETIEQECDDLLQQHSWNFATVRTPLGRNLQVPSHAIFGWRYAYNLPSGMLRLISVHDNEEGRGVLDYKLESIYTTQLLDNRDFDSDTGWTKGTGWTISDGTANHAAGTASSLTQAVTLVTSGVYRVAFTLSGVTAGNVTPRFTGGSTVTESARSTNGVHAVEMTAVAGNTTFDLLASSTFVGSVDNVFMWRVDGFSAPAVVTDAESVWLRYVREVRNVSVMPPAFRNLLTLRLAKIFAAASDPRMVPMIDAEYRTALRVAKSIDGIEDAQDKRPEGAWIQARRGGWGRGNTFQGAG